ncbi:hypothetical protein M0R04_06095 [Candidatus Dojkabacteria bacterium]|jgi:hypothetical protein|nr:hypothetical protein [Candidatus Dojkabacteria bacterium]
MNYQDEYQQFVKILEAGEPIPAEDVGRLIVRMASHFSIAVSNAVKAEYAYNKKLAEFESKRDENDQILSSTKAEAQAKATPEYFAYTSAKGEVTSLEQMINALKSMQKSLQNDFNFSSI